MNKKKSLVCIIDIPIPLWQFERFDILVPGRALLLVEELQVGRALPPFGSECTPRCIKR